MTTPVLDFEHIKKQMKRPDKLRDDELRSMVQAMTMIMEQDRQQNQILFYKPVSERAYGIHQSQAKLIGIGGGNGSSKTESCLVEIIAQCTGRFPHSIEADMRGKWRGMPLKTRVIVESLTTTLHPTILPKLKWWVWTGVSEPGGDKGHWGWVPKDCLLDGSWDRSWSEKLRTLTVKCHDPDTGEHLGNSEIQFMSHDQDPQDFASGDYHIVMMDEPPGERIFRENEARTMRVNGRMMLAFTWPDDPSIPVDWIFDEIYEPGQPGPDKHPNVDWIELHTTENPNLDQDAVRAQMERWSETDRQIRIYGRPIRFSNLIHPDFTDRESWWCFDCGRQTMAISDPEPECSVCQSVRVCTYSHVRDFTVPPSWPALCLLDPHPRKPHFLQWVAVDPADDLWVTATEETSEDLAEIKALVEELEGRLGLTVRKRVIDPNMGASPASVQRNITWQDEFRKAGLRFDLGDDSDVGRARINEYLKPDPYREAPRIHIHPRCGTLISQLRRYSWDDYKRADGRDQKQKPRDTYDDHPTLLKYALNENPQFERLRVGAPVIRAGGRRKGLQGRRS